ncbi:hypothetical protein OG730_40960 [Streptomyces sp. NBC_01298]|uniref:hypothetical protein n=1 Tax=Streptomyces sp. NBC_01298 TaxID=2903817 RepID=UPI002E13C75C|nr:hypothetical protein OG730_40960 [Streptomyces sp. NBC_01298]
MTGIPAFKLLSNGPWLVGAGEVEEALNRYEISAPTLRFELEADQLWCDWIGWLRETAGGGGFSVE